MPKIIANSELAAILLAIQQCDKQANLEYLENSLKLPRRTVQRRLKLLLEKGLIKAINQGRARYYQRCAIQAEASLVQPKQSLAAEGEVYVPISTEAKNIKQLVQQSIIYKQPVSYHADFLEKYQPNHSYYLTADMRQSLLELGTVSDSQHYPAGTYARQIYDRLLIDLSWNSSRLEGNTYSLLETERLLVLGEMAESNTARNMQMILNHKQAIEFLVDTADEIGFNRYTLLNIHGLLANNLLSNPMAGGALRSIAVGISHTVYQPLAVPALIEEYFELILKKVAQIIDPFEQAFFLMVHLPYLQPFEDVNKRVSRLAANISLIKHNLCPLSFVDVPEKPYIDGLLGVYELNRMELLRDVFVWAYQRSCARYAAIRQSLGEPDPFRLRYRQQIGVIVAEVVGQCLNKKQAIRHIKTYTEQAISRFDQQRFIEVVETELMYLHEGNIARYRLRPSQYALWQKVWQEK